MKSISESLKSHIGQDVTTLTTCLKITRKDGFVLGFTSLDKELLFEGAAYKPDCGLEIGSLQNNVEVEAAEVSTGLVIDNENIKEHDILKGKFDDADMELFLINYQDVSAGKIPLFNGFISKITLSNGKADVEVKGLLDKLNRQVCQQYSSSCRAKFCDGKCGLNKADFTFTGQVDSIDDNGRIYCNSLSTKENNYFNYGVLTFTSGANKDLSIEIKSFYGGDIIPMINPVYIPNVGDTFTIVTGCDKKFSTCVNKFNNAINFRGEPHIPGNDYIMQVK